MRHIPLPFSASGRGGVTIEAPVGEADFQGLEPTIAQNVYYISNAGDDDANDGLSEATPWATIGKVNGFTFSPGDTIQFNRGDVFSDATLNIGQAGTNGNPILVKDYGTGDKPQIGSTALNRLMTVDTQWIAVQNLHFKDCQGDTGSALVYITADNFDWQDCDVTGNAVKTAQLNTNLPGVRVDADNATFDGGTITDVNGFGLGLRNNAANVDIRNMTFNTYAQGQDAVGDHEGDAFNTGPTTWNGSVTIEDCTFDNQNNALGENSIDCKGVGTWTIRRCTFVDSRQSALLCGNGPAGGGTAVIEDCDFDVTINNTGRMCKSGVQTGDSQDITYRRCKFIANNTDSEIFQFSESTTTTFEACSFEVPTGAPLPRILEVREGTTVVLDNCTLLSRNGNTCQEHIFVHADYTGPGVTVRNTILDSDATTGLLLESDVADPFTLSNNLYESGATNWFDINGTTYQEADVPATYGGTGSDTGDPLFASEDDTNANYLLPNAGSPALNLGSNAFNPATDLVGTSYDDPPNAGCREGSA